MSEMNHELINTIGIKQRVREEALLYDVCAVEGLIDTLEKDISEWESTNERCFFKIKKTYGLELLYESSEPHNKIHIISGPSCPLKFKLDMLIEKEGECCNAVLVCDADINQFLKMIIEKPLHYLFNYMADELVAIKE